MESVVCFYSGSWFIVALLGLILFGVASFQVLVRSDDNPRPFTLMAFVAMILIIIGNEKSKPPEASVVTLAPGEELVGTDLSKSSSKHGRRAATVIVRLPDGKFSVRDFLVPNDKELVVRTSTSSEK